MLRQRMDAASAGHNRAGAPARDRQGHLFLALAVLGACCLLGCQRSRSGPTEFPIEKPPLVSAADRAAGEALYAERCLRCHGERGHGDGPQAAATHPRPQRLSDRLWQANASNSRLRRVLLQGGGAVNKSPLMPGNPDLAQKPALVDALIAVIRSFAEPAGAD